MLDRIAADNAPVPTLDDVLGAIEVMTSADSKAVRAMVARIAKLRDDLDVDQALDALKTKTKAKMTTLRSALKAARAEAKPAPAANVGDVQPLPEEYPIGGALDDVVLDRAHGRRFVAQPVLSSDGDIVGNRPLFSLAAVVGAGVYVDRDNVRDLEVAIESERGRRETYRVPADLTVRPTDWLAAARARGVLFDGEAGRQAWVRVGQLTQPDPVVIRDVVGWSADDDGRPYFMFPSGVTWGVEGDAIRLSERGRHPARLRPTGGTWEGFRTAMSAISRSRSVSVRVGVLVGLAGMLLGLASRGTIVICFVGRTSQGKSFRQKIGVSLTGSPAKGGQMCSMNSTDIAVEIPLERGSCTGTGFDELQFVKAAQISRLIYVAAGESGRARANREGGEGLVRSWRGGVVTLSAEYGLAQRLREDGETHTGGLNVRVIEVSVDGEGEVVDADEFREIGAVLDNHGWAGPPFLNEVAARGWIADPSLMEARVAEIVDDLPDVVDLRTGEADPARRRAASAVAYLRLAGEVALAADLIDPEFDLDEVTASVWAGALGSGMVAGDPVDTAIETLFETLNARRGVDVVEIMRTPSGAALEGSTSYREAAAWIDVLDGERVYLLRKVKLAEFAGKAADERALKDRLLADGIAIPNRRKRRPGVVWSDWAQPVGRVSFLVLKASEVEGSGEPG